ncbi:pilus assembly protein CpaB [Vibrio sp. VPAP30]|uniref:pilus assembly protein CpaB n=1 Tax=Vibrio sp. VPAP30 TaxID=1647102 RepID=UPI000657EDAD|nr:pilus assembly protein CpaB [Vibrio sp. VPAP30]KLN63563.1 pilus assembly protein CpaB [Vibrio sp. VPAP30]
MNRTVILVLVALAIFSTFIFINNNYLSSNEVQQSEVIQTEPKVTVLVIDGKAEKGQIITTYSHRTELVKLTQLEGVDYTPQNEIIIKQGALFRRDLNSGELISQEDISNPGDRDYMFLSINEGELPYYYHVTGLGVVQTLALFPGDKVSFVSTTSSENNLLEDGYGDVGGLVSRVIISGARVLQVIKGDEDEDAQDAEDKQYSIVIALKMRDVLKLEMAQKVGDVNIVPAEIENRYLSIRSSDLLETQFGVRELRGKD